MKVEFIENMGVKGNAGTMGNKVGMKEKKKPTRGVERDAIETTHVTGSTKLGQKRKLDDEENVQPDSKQAIPSFSSRDYSMDLIPMNCNSSKKAKPTHPAGLLPRFKTNIDAPLLWNKTNVKRASGMDSEVEHGPETDKFSNLYGGLSDEDESKEAAAWPSMLASKNVKV